MVKYPNVASIVINYLASNVNCILFSHIFGTWVLPISHHSRFRLPGGEHPHSGNHFCNIEGVNKEVFD